MACGWSQEQRGMNKIRNCSGPLFLLSWKKEGACWQEIKLVWGIWLWLLEKGHPHEFRSEKASVVFYSSGFRCFCWLSLEKTSAWGSVDHSLSFHHSISLLGASASKCEALNLLRKIRADAIELWDFGSVPRWWSPPERVKTFWAHHQTRCLF